MLTSQSVAESAGTLVIPILVTVFGFGIVMGLLGVAVVVGTIAAVALIGTAGDVAAGEHDVDLAAHRPPAPVRRPLSCSVEGALRGLQPLPVTAGDVVIRQGDPADRFYVIGSGSFVVDVGLGRRRPRAADPRRRRRLRRARDPRPRPAIGDGHGGDGRPAVHDGRRRVPRAGRRPPGHRGPAARALRHAGRRDRGAELRQATTLGGSDLHHEVRLCRRSTSASTTPLVRDGDRATGTLRPATWDEALDRIAAGLRAAGDGARPDGRSGCSAARKATNEVNFAAQKFARAGPRQQQHRQLQPHLTRPLCRRSGDRVRRWRRNQLISRS